VNDPWSVYILKCADDTLYCGVTKNLIKRLAEHNAGRGAKYTRGRRPCSIVITVGGMSQKTALRLERKVKSLRRDQKVKFLENYLTMPPEDLPPLSKLDLEAIDRAYGSETDL